MRTVEFQEVLINVAELLGVQPNHTDITSIVKRETYTVFINRRTREGWEHAFWPEWTIIEQRQYKPDWLTGTTYALDDIILNPTDQLYYQSLQAANTGNQPDTSPLWWELAVNWERFIPYDQAGQTAIGEVKAVYSKNPRINQRYPGEVGFQTTDTGILVSQLAPVKPYIEFRKVVPAKYAVASPTADFPKVIQLFVELAAYADGLRDDGQQKRAQVERGEAYAELARIEEIVFGQQRQSERTEVRSY